MYLLSGSTLSINSMLFSYIVNTIPPLSINLTNLGNAPDHSVNTPSFRTSWLPQSQLFLYRCFASILCIRVLIVSTGCVTYTVIRPARPPIPNVLAAPNFSPGATYDSAICLKKLYDPNRVAEFAAWRAVVGTKPWKKPRMPRSRAMMGTAWRKPRRRGFAALRSSILGLSADGTGLRGRDSLQCGLDTLEWGYGKQRLGHTSSKAGDYGSRAGDMAILILQHGLKLVECHEPHSSLQGVPDYQRCATGVPCWAKFWPRELIGTG